MVGFLRFLFILMIIWFLSRIIFRYVVPWFVMRFIKKQQDKYSDYYGNQDQKKEGDVEIKMNKNEKTGRAKDAFGEYVDFEEIEPEQDKENNE